MDQSELHTLERQCIQEEAPECTAACPLHVDARAFVGHMAAGRWSDAGKVLHKSMPLPGILGRICDAPCQLRCKRVEVEETIHIGLLERSCVSKPISTPRLPPLPAKNRSIAVLGSGLSSLTAAWDLARKGYSVTIYEPGRTIGAMLTATYTDVLPAAIVAAEIEPLARLGVRFKTEQSADIDPLLKNFDAVYLGLDGLGGFDRTQVTISPGSQTTSVPKLFAGGGGDAALRSPVWQAAEGRWAATSIDRCLQNVSLTAGRDKEGPFQTRLFTRTEGVPVRAAILPADPLQGYSDTEAVSEASRCLQCECLECVKVCAYLETFGGYPRKYARNIYNNESIVMGSHQANKLINSCSLCGLCEAVCPNDFAMQDVCLSARRELVRRGKMPPSAHEFALLDLQFSRSDRFVLARHAPGEDTSAFVFFPGCQLCASAPEQVHRVYDHLRARLSGGVGVWLACCAAPAQWAGREDLFAEARGELRRRWQILGEPTLITACASCHLLFGQAPDSLPVISLWEVLAEHAPLPEPSAQPERPKVAVHDPCTTRHAPHIQNAVRQLLTRSKISFTELKTSRGFTECCGFGGLMENANPDLARETLHRRAGQSTQDYLAYCAMCRDALASVDKRCLHLLDLLFPPADHSDCAARRRPGWSQRQENRTRLKAHLLKTLWKEEPSPMQAPHRAIRLFITPEAAPLLERRRILEEDIQKTILHAETTGQKLVHPQNGHYLAGFRPHNAFFWVEYMPREDGFLILNAYTHRMEAGSI